MSYLALNDNDPRTFTEGETVKLKKGRKDVTVVWHREGTVRVRWTTDKGELREENYSAVELEADG